MSSPDDDVEFDEFADLDAKLDDYFADAKEEDSGFHEMTQQFFKGSGDMESWDKVDKVSHQAAVAHGDTEEHVDEEWNDFADTFFGESDSDGASALEGGPTGAPAADAALPGASSGQTIRFDFGGPSSAAASSAPSDGLEPASVEVDKFNLFLRKPANPKQKEAAIKIIAEVKSVEKDEAEALVKKPFIKVLIDVVKADADSAHAKFKEAGLVSTIKKCT